MSPNTNSDPNAAAPAEQPTPQTAPAADPSSETVTITRGDLERYKSYEGRVPNLQRENEALKRQVTPQQGQDNTRQLLERAHSFGQQNKSLEETLQAIQGEQTNAQYQAAVLKIAQFLDAGGTLPAGPGTAGGADVTKALAEYRLDPADPYVAAQMQGKTFANDAEAELFAARVFRDKQLSPNPNQAQAPTAPGGGVHVTGDLDALYAQYEDAFREPTRNAELLTNLAAQIKSLGG